MMDLPLKKKKHEFYLVLYFLWCVKGRREVEQYHKMCYQH